MIKKAIIGTGAALGTIVVAVLTAWAVHFGGPHGKLTGCITQNGGPVLQCVKNVMCANQDFPRFTCSN
jgi:hypothetical protein